MGENVDSQLLADSWFYKSFDLDWGLTYSPRGDTMNTQLCAVVPNAKRLVSGNIFVGENIFNRDEWYERQ